MLENERSGNICFAAYLIELSLHRKRLVGPYSCLRFDDMQAVKPCALPLCDEDRLLERIPAFQFAAYGDQNIGEKTICITSGRACFSPTSRLGGNASFQDQIRCRDTRLDLDPQFLLQRGAVFRDPDI